MTAVIGIDPGNSGALVWMDGTSFEVRDMPLLQVNKRKLVDASQIHGILYRWPLAGCQCFIERAQSMPGMGVSGAFNYGMGFGIIQGVLASMHVPLTLVQAAKWKRDLQVQKDKDAARARASQLLPHMADQWPLKKHDGRAEAALIAYWGQRQLGAT